MNPPNAAPASREWDYAYDDDHARVEGTDAVTLLIRDTDTGEVVDALGGITLASLQVSDHGNVNISPEDEAYLASLAAEYLAA